MKTLRLSFLAFLLLAKLSSNVAAQTYAIDWYKVAGGGGTSTGGVYSVSGTIGQHDASAAMTGGSYSLSGGFWSLVAVQTPGAPTLFITTSGNNAVLYWSSGAAGYVLENNGNLTTSNGWSTVAPTPVPQGGFNYVTNTVAPGNNFYRLRHP
ncbi:MAG: hypothetical protein JWR19_4552 [Pedosphaera sp.]|nr:hypothetical protein [Pedosphaera sp.]